MIDLFIHQHAQEDLEQLWQDNETAAAEIEVFLEEAKGDQELLDNLTVHNFGCYGSEPYHVNKWQEMWRKRIDLWRVKLWVLENRGIQYRIIYAFIVGEDKFYVLGIAPKDFNYDANHPLSKRILDDYRDLKY